MFFFLFTSGIFIDVMLSPACLGHFSSVCVLLLVLSNHGRDRAKSRKRKMTPPLSSKQTGTSQGHRHPLMVSWPLVHEDTQQLKTKRHNYPQCMNMAILFGRQFFVCDMSVFAVNVWLSDLKNRHFSEGYNFFVNKVGVCVCVIMGCINKTDLNSTGVKEI